MTISKTAQRASRYAKSIKAYGSDPVEAVSKKLQEESKEFQLACFNGYMANLFGFLHDADSLGFKRAFEIHIKDSKEDELADVILTALAASVEMGIDIEKHIDLKMRYNEVRR